MRGYKLSDHQAGRGGIFCLRHNQRGNSFSITNRRQGRPHQAVDFHRDQGTANLGHFEWRASRHAHPFHFLRTGTLGQRRKRRGQYTSLPVGVFELPPPVFRKTERGNQIGGNHKSIPNMLSNCISIMSVVILLFLKTGLLVNQLYPHQIKTYEYHFH